MSNLLWAQGCEHCTNGLVLAPPIDKDNKLTITVVRRHQARRGELAFCECRAGLAMKRHLLGDDPVPEWTPTFSMTGATS